MLGLQDTISGGALPTRTYRCVACAATFPGLSSLLVHQASHANDGNSLDKLQPSPSSPKPSCTHCGIVFASKELLDQHCCTASSFPASSSNFICDCGERFQYYNALLEHRRLHVQGSNLKVQDCAAGQVNKWETKGAVSRPVDQTDPSPRQDFSSVSGSNSGASDLKFIPLLSSTETAPEAGIWQDSPVPASPLSQFNSIPLVHTASVSQHVEFSALPAFTAPQDLSSLSGVNMIGSFPPSDLPASSSSLPIHQPQDLQQPKRKTLKKMLFSEFMKRLSPAQISSDPNEREVSSKKVASTVAVAAVPVSSPGPSVSQLRRLLNRSARRKVSSQASAILNLITSSKPPIKRANYLCNLSRTFLPVVALETRQKLAGGSKDGLEGRHQCGRCRRIFQDMDSLILHHAVHRKERVNGCQRCGQLLISRVTVPEKHLCPQTSMQSTWNIFSVGTVLPSPSSTHAQPTRHGNMVVNPFRPLQRNTSVSRVKKSYHCPVCNHNYARLYNLKRHRCYGMNSLQEAARTHKKGDFHSTPIGLTIDGELQTIEKQNEVLGDEFSLMQKSVGVGTDGPHGIKLEALDVASATGLLSPHSLKAKSPHLGVWSGSPKSFMPFLPKSFTHTLSRIAEETEGGCSVSVQNQSPVQSQTHVLQDHLAEDKRKGEVASGGAHRRADKGQWTMPIDSEIDKLIEAEDGDDTEDMIDTNIKDSIDSTPNQNISQKQAFQAGIKCFNCSHCGRSYTRRFTLHEHIKKCHLGARAPMQQNIRKALQVNKNLGGKPRFDCLQCGRSFSYRETLVLHQKTCQPNNGRGDEIGDHTGIKKGSNMPQRQDYAASQGRLFVLPPSSQAKGNCAGNNKPTTGGDWGIMSLPSLLPRKVTCECGAGFTCPRLLFEHLQLHAQESYICPDCGENLQSWPVFEAHLRTHQRSACQKCNQTFSHHSSLVRHLRKNKCTGETGGEKKHSCPRCKLPMPNALSLRLHMQSPTCKPSQKLICCPVCSRAFGAVEGLQRHLMTHTHPNAFRCQLCQRSYPSLRSLKDHRRKVHRMVKEISRSGQERVGGVELL